MSTIKLDELLSAIPTSLKNELLFSYNQIQTNFVERKWEPSELNGGKFCECVYTILSGYINGSFPNAVSKPRNMVVACQQLENSPTSFPRSIRIQIPRMLIALYEIRNNRGVGHVNGDINPNHMDATCVLYVSKWILAELIRVFHQVDIDTAENTIESIVERITPLIWEIGENKRILNSSLSYRDKTLLLLYNSNDSIDVAKLISWTEYSNSSYYKKKILIPLHKEKYIEYDQNKSLVSISPIGISYVEKNIINP